MTFDPYSRLISFSSGFEIACPCRLTNMSPYHRAQFLVARCHLISIQFITCLQVGPMSLEWPVAPIARSDESSPSSSHENTHKALFQLSHTPVGGGMHFSHLRYNMILQIGIHVATSPMEVCDVFLGTLGVSLGLFFLHRETESSNSNISGSSLKTTSFVSRRYTGKKNFFRPFRCGPRGSSYSIRSFLVTRMLEDRPYASTRTFCLRMLL